MIVTEPSNMSEMFARAFNSRNIDGLLALYEPDAVLLVDGSTNGIVGHEAISAVLQGMLHAPGTMISRNSFCVVHGGLALLRVDWDLIANDGSVMASGSSAEIVRRQPNGTWLYTIDHATGASLPRAS